MIRLTRLNNREIAINCDLIEWVESNPDTTVRMVSGEYVLVLESVGDVISRIVDYRKSLLASAGIAAVLTSGWSPSEGWLRKKAPADESADGPAAEVHELRPVRKE